MTRIFLYALLLMPTGLFAQNNPIFYGGIGDGHSLMQTTSSYNQPAYRGGQGDAWHMSFNSPSFVSVSSKGGNGDGWNLTSNSINYAKYSSRGGQGDAWAQIQTSPQVPRPNYFGGTGDGWANTYTPLGPLPVEIVLFEAVKKGSAVQLDWKSSFEKNSSHYIVEKSADAVNFKEFAQVQSLNQEEGSAYQVFDNAPYLGYNYYRLKMVDIDGQFQYSPTRHVIFEKNNQALDYRIYPNPSTGLITFEFPATTQNENLVINITNMTGRVVQQYKCTSQDRLIQMNLSQLPRSTYFVQMRCSTYDIIEKIILH